MCATCGCSPGDAGVRVIDPRSPAADHGDHDPGEAEHGHGRHGHEHGDHERGNGHEHEHGHAGHGNDEHGHSEHGHGHGHKHPEHGHRDPRHDDRAHGHRIESGTEVCGVEPDTRTVSLEVDLLAKNDALAGRNRRWLADHGVLALNLMSSPGSGKTTLLERTITDLGRDLPCAVLEGDQETLLDADRIGATGARVVQVNTGAGCHLDADMVVEGLRALDPAPGSVLFVENVGNLVCPALFDLGESSRVVIISVTEGTDKPLKYPHMFRTADLVLVNKIDLLPYVDFDVARCVGYARRARPDVEVLEVSATRGDGLDAWYAWLRRLRHPERPGLTAP